METVLFIALSTYLSERVLLYSTISKRPPRECRYDKKLLLLRPSQAQRAGWPGLVIKIKVRDDYQNLSTSTYDLSCSSSTDDDRQII